MPQAERKSGRLKVVGFWPTIHLSHRLFLSAFSTTYTTYEFSARLRFRNVRPKMRQTYDRNSQ